LRQIYATLSIFMLLILLTGTGVSAINGSQAVASESPTRLSTEVSCPPDCASLQASVKIHGADQIIVKLNVPFDPNLTDQKAIDQQRATIRSAQSQLVRGFHAVGDNYSLVILEYDVTPYIVLQATTTTLDYLIKSPLVLEISEDTPTNPEFDLELSSIKTEVARLDALSQQPDPKIKKCLVPQCADLLATVQKQKSIRLIILLNTGWHVNGNLGPGEVQMQGASIRLAQATLLKLLKSYNIKVVADWLTIPGMSLEVDEGALREMIASPLVANLAAEVVGTLN
jgi:hypothetical protein